MRERCEPFLERLGSYLDGELGPEGTREVEEHLRSCSHCRRARDEMAAADRLLRRGLNIEAADEKTEEEAAERVLARLREEPEPDWARGRRSEPHADVTSAWKRAVGRIRSHRLNPAIGWAGGLAAATVAVLLAIRLGMPERPATTGATKDLEVEQTPAADLTVDEGTAPEQVAGSGEKTVAPQAGTPVSADRLRSTRDAGEARRPEEKGAIREPEPEGGTRSRVPPRTGPAPSPEKPLTWDSGKGVALPSGEAQAPTGERSEPGTNTEGYQDLATAPAADHPRGPQATEAAPRAGRSEPGSPETIGQAKMTAETPREEADKQEDRHATVPPDVGPVGRPGETLLRVRSYAEGPAAQGAGLAFSEMGADSIAQGVVSPAETLATAADLPGQLELAARALSSIAETEIDSAERARRWRTIGDLWEWLGRRDASSVFFEKAVQAYEEGIAIDPDAGAPDPVRLTRARAGSERAPEPAEHGNKVPGRR